LNQNQWGHKINAKSMGSDSIDPELLRPPIPAPDSGLYSSLYSSLNMLFKLRISQYPGFIGRFSDFTDVLCGYSALE